MVAGDNVFGNVSVRVGVGDNVGVGIGVGIGVCVGVNVRFLGRGILYRGLLDGCNADARLTSCCNAEVMLNYIT